MFLYFLIVRIAALLGHPKARKLIAGQHRVMAEIKADGRMANGEYKGAVWVHAASVGEFEQARPLIELIRANYPERKIVVTFFSPSGYEMRCHYEGADAVMYLPLATRANARLWLDRIEPCMAILVKYEFWPAYLRELKRRAIPAYSICAIFRERQRFFRWWGKSQLALLDCFTHIFVQDEHSAALLRGHGITRCSVAGDTRFDRMAEVMANGEWRKDERLKPVEQFVSGCPRVIVAGSTWPKDEELLAQYMAAKGEGTKLILVPHEIDSDHLHTIFQLFRGRMVRYSDIMANGEWRMGIHGEVLVVDVMGLLSSLYRLGHAAYIGGGFGVGIHNTIEAAAYGRPVLFGPNYNHFREAQGLIDAGAARSIRTLAELGTALDEALDRHDELGARAAQYVRAELGATSKIYNGIFNEQTANE